LGRERQRRQHAEEEAATLRAQLRILSESTEAAETVEEAPERAEPRPAMGEAQEAVQRPWWRRVFGR
jgi:hypothetical protein